MYVLLAQNQLTIDGRTFPSRLNLNSLLEKLRLLILASSGDYRATRIGIKFLSEFGEDLYQAIFSNHLKSYEKSPILLEIKERCLSQLPWELMCHEGEWLSRTRGIIRIAGPGKSLNSGNIYAPLKVLVALASPLYMPGATKNSQPDPINLRSQLEIFTEGLKRKKFFAVFNIQQHITRRRLADELIKDYHILHFVGHGNRGSLSLEDDYAQVDEIDTAWLRENLSGSSLYLALFNSCYTASVSFDNSCAGIAKTLLDAGVPLVVGMQQAITEGAARVFAQNFYRSLAEGKSICQALTLSRRAIADSPGCLPWEWITPVLFVQPDMLDKIESPFVLPEVSGKASIKINRPKTAIPSAFEREEIFVGQRETQVEILKTLSFTPYQPERVVVLKGPGGAGKTAVALQIMSRLAERLERIIWICANTYSPPAELYQTIGQESLALVNNEFDLFKQLARKLTLEIKVNEDLLRLKEKILHRLSASGKTLIILDSLEAFRDSETLQTFIRQLPLNCCVLLTCRYSLPGFRAREITIQALSWDDTQTLLYYHMRQPLEERILLQIYKTSEGNPLIIRLSLAHLKDSFEFTNNLSKGQPDYLFDYLFQRPLEMAGEEARAAFCALSLFKPYADAKGLSYVSHIKDINNILEKLNSSCFFFPAA